MDRPIFFKTIILKGRDGTSIGSLEKTATAGVVDTYTITLTDGETYTFEVTNGTSIANISYTSSSGNVDTYTITLTDGSTQTFQVTNGEDFTVPTDGVIYFDGTTVPDGYEETNPPSGSGQYAVIDDANASLQTTYSSSKIEQLISGIGGGGVDYSTTEQDTGLKWIDEKNIYQKTIVLANEIDISSSGANIPNTEFSGLNIENIVNATAYRLVSDNRDGCANIPISMWLYNGDYNIYAIGTWSGVRTITIQYTKTTDTV